MPTPPPNHCAPAPGAASMPMPARDRRPRPLRPAVTLLLLATLVLAAGCERALVLEPYDSTEEVAAFFPRFNRDTEQRLQRQLEQLEDEMESWSRGEDPDNGMTEEGTEAALELARERVRQPEFFTFATLDDLPADLQWENGMDEPEIGDPNAIKGGAFTDWIPSFPPTIRTLGSNSNNFFRSSHYDYVEMSLISVHPDTGNIIPAIAREWAVSDDRRTVYFRIDPEATYSDGVPVTADDFFMMFYMQLSEYPSNPFGNEYYANQFSNITRYDERTLSISLPEAKPLTPYFASVVPAPRHFYREFGPDFEDRYQWRPRPTTGAYEVREEGLRMGRSIALHRVTDWWARDRKFYRHRYNADVIEYRVIRSPEKAFELFRLGTIDWMILNLPEFWYERSEIDPVHNGYIERVTFYNVHPRVNRGFYVNAIGPLLGNRDIREGIAYASNFEAVIEFELRNDYTRLRTFADGYGELSHPTLTARPFNERLAREAFARAGFTSQGPDGVLRNAAGERLSVSVTYSKSPPVDRIIQRLRQEALRSGLDLVPDDLDGATAFTKASRKEHQLGYFGFGLSPPFMDYHQFFHSSNAFEADGTTPRPNNNNLFSFADPEMDRLLDAHRSATTMEAMAELGHRIEEIIHEQAIFVPAATQDYYRLGHWRWLRFPEESFNVRVSYGPIESYVWWIDEDLKAETLAARRSGETFPEVNAVFDQFRESR